MKNKKDQLTRREGEVLELLDKGFLEKEIGDKLGIVLSTVKWHASNIYSKLGVNTARTAIKEARRRKWLKD